MPYLWLAGGKKEEKKTDKCGSDGNVFLFFFSRVILRDSSTNHPPTVLLLSLYISSQYTYFLYRYMLGLAGIPSLIQLIGFLFLPESPRYVMKKGNEGRARQILQKVRGTRDVEQELEEIKENCRQDEESMKNCKWIFLMK